MNIGIDARILERKMTGIGRFLNTFLGELAKMDSNNNYFLFSYDKLDLGGVKYTNITTIKSSLPQKLYAPFWINFILPGYLKKNKIDLFFSVNQLVPLIKPRNIKYILVLHDVIYKVNKRFHPFIYRKYLQFFIFFSVKKSDLIITVSEYSKRDILKFYKVNENKVKVVYQAAEKLFSPMDISEEEKVKIKKILNLPEHIILYLGMIENRKNINGILKIADLIFQKNTKIKFLLIGKIGYGGKKIISEINKRENVVHLLNVDDDLLRKLYNISSVFLFPSFYEGFGYPPLEAMQSGLPVIAADNTSLKEIINDGGILHDANDYKSFADDILRLLNDADFYNNLRERGIRQASNFNITKTAREIVNIFQSFS